MKKTLNYVFSECSFITFQYRKKVINFKVQQQQNLHMQKSFWMLSEERDLGTSASNSGLLNEKEIWDS